MANKNPFEFLGDPTALFEIPTKSDLEQVERDFCLLPDVYRKYITSFGTGSIADFIWILNPASRNPHLNFASRNNYLRTNLTTARRDYEELANIAIYPELRGLLAFGSTDNGDALFWQVDGASDDWKIVIISERDFEVEFTELNTEGFFLRMSSNSLKLESFPDDLEFVYPSFRPFNSPAESLWPWNS